VPHTDRPDASVSIEPPLEQREVAVLAGLAGRADAVRRMWPGQPGPRSPWQPCPDGCCLRADRRSIDELATWLRFLIREVLAPRAAKPRARAQALGLPGEHRVEGRLHVEGRVVDRVLVVRHNRVRETDPAASGQRTER